MLLNVAKCQDYSFFHFWVTKGKPTVGEGGFGIIGMTIVSEGVLWKDCSKIFANFTGML